MDQLSSATLLKAALWAYLIAGAGSLLALRAQKLANLIGFGGAIFGGLCGIGASLRFLIGGGDSTDSFDLWNSLVPYVRLAVKLDALGAFFLLILSVLVVALSIYSLGYVKTFYGGKNVAVLGAFYNGLLVATTLVFTSANAFFFLIAWELMALTAYCLVSFEHEKTEARNAGVLYFIMSHIGTGCLILGFLILFQAAGGTSPGDYGFDRFRAI